MDAEDQFLDKVPGICLEYRDLRVVLEHITTAESVQRIRIWNADPCNYRIAATITVHHLLLTLDDIVGGTLNPHAFCKPIAKRKQDRLALVGAATSGDPYFFLGTDSAPHFKSAKHLDGCAGIFSAPVAMEALIQVFEDQGKLELLGDFTSRFGAEFYGLPMNEGVVTFKRTEWEMQNSLAVPHSGAASIIPFLAGHRLRWEQVA
jgi:dihydroorotase